MIQNAKNVQVEERVMHLEIVTTVSTITITLILGISIKIFKQFSQNITSNIYSLKWATIFGTLYHHQALFYKTLELSLKLKMLKYKIYTIVLLFSYGIPFTKSNILVFIVYTSYNAD